MIVRTSLIAALLTIAYGQQTFHIEPLRPIADLRAEALRQQPPHEAGPFHKPQLIDLAKLDRRIKLEIRYATADNFMSTPFYSSARAFMQKPAAQALLQAHRELLKKGYGC